VIIHLYEEFGPESVKLLDGMFAFAIFDGDELFLARDPLGIKPLYYAKYGESFYFASEIKALHDLGTVYEFPPGHWYHSAIGFQKYFEVQATTEPKLKSDSGKVDQFQDTDLELTATRIQDCIRNAVFKRLMSEVPVGVFLSGGLDSSIIAYLAKEGLERLETFSIGMDGGEDLYYSDIVAKFIDSKHHRRIISQDEILKALPEVIYYLESFDTALVRSAIANYFLAELAKDSVKVVLSGEGADELYAGYHYLKNFNRSEDLNRELIQITAELHNTNLQRTDRMTMAHGLEGRVPFLDLESLELALSLSTSIKLSTTPSRSVEKWILRKAFEGLLPDEVVWRTKQKFSKGCGSAEVVKQLAEAQISDAEFEGEKYVCDSIKLKSKEELYYYRIFKEFYDPNSMISTVGRSRSL
jgi:asparagine synthase (glutamine-hydrolysing)